MIRRYLIAALPGVLLAGALACSPDKLDVPSYQSPTVDGIGGDPNAIQLLATGLLADFRGQNPILNFGVLGRETYNYFATDGRFISHALVGIPGPQRLDPSGFYNGNWAGPFQVSKNAINLINIANTSTVTPLTAAQKSATSGFAKTIRAIAMLYVALGRDSLGAPTAIPESFSDPQPFVSRDSLMKFVAGTLDEAKTDLSAGGAAFPFVLHSGFTGFDTPATYLKFNRAIAARVAVIRGSQGCGATCYQQALTALGESFAKPIGGIASLADLDIGAFQIYSSAAGDTQNGLSYSIAPTIFAHASIFTDAQKKADGVTLDDRYTRKITRIVDKNGNPTSVNPPSSLNIPATHRYLLYPTNASPIPIIRTEELALLRAEANWALGNTAAALQDINNVRQVSGGLPALASLATGSAGLDVIMYERRYSLLSEGVRWPDMRRWGRLGLLPIDQAGQFVAKVMPIPQQECDARTTKPNGC
jgi:hypothetical protein